ncbi:unnamed protein product [Parajaminaea phylloscopi]
MPPAAAASTVAPPPALGYDSDDSDCESDDSVTNVQLGLADGELEDGDESNPLVSRIGGQAAWLPTASVPPAEVATCKHCKNVMELLVQIFAPLEGSPYDRIILAWGCARPVCQRKGAGSLRVVRHLQHNPRWAAKLAKKKARSDAREERARQQVEQQRQREKDAAALKQVNPFSVATKTQGSFAFGSDLFGGGFKPAGTGASAQEGAQAPQDTTSSAEGDDDSDASSSDEEEEEEQDRLAEEMAMKAALSGVSARENDWTATTTSSYQPPLYLNTVPEASSSARAGERAANAKLTAKEAAELKASGGGTASNATSDELAGLEKEGYERMMLDGMDEVLEKFIARVGAEGRQVVRYEMGGQPLPFSAQGDVYDALWPATKAVGSKVVGAAAARRYDASRIPPCEACGGARTFEVQLMPNLVNTLRADKIASAPSDHAREIGEESPAKPAPSVDEETRKRQELEAALGKKLLASSDANNTQETSLDRKTGLVWSTALVFVCAQDCCISRDSVEGETWREEWVGLQFED